MNVFALTFGDENCASSQYRIFQYRDELARRGIQLDALPANEFTDWSALGDFDAVIIQKRLFGGRAVRRLRRGARRLVYDVDDAIWLPHGRPHHPFTRWRTERRLQAVCAAADLCLAANGLLHAKLAEFSRNARVLPMALDPKIWTRGDRSNHEGLRVGWAGSPANLSYLEAIEDDLIRLLKAHRNVEIQVVCGVRPGFKKGLKYTHIPFAPGRDSEAVRGFDIGLLPLPVDPFAAHKSPIKALQYMASGVVTVASPVGATLDLIKGDCGVFASNPGEWHAALDRLIGDVELRSRIGNAARKWFEESFSLDATASELALLLTGLTETPAGD